MRVTEKGQVTIPKHIRERLGIKPGSEVDFVATASHVRLTVRDRQLNGSSRGEQIKRALDEVAGTIDLDGLTTDEYMKLLRGPREDLDPC